MARWLGHGGTGSRTLDGTRPLVALAVFAASLLAYGVIVVELLPRPGGPAVALMLVPAAIAGWYAGPLGGGLVSVALVVLDAEIRSLTHSLSLSVGYEFAASAVVMVATAITVGELHTRNVTLTRIRAQLLAQLAEREEMAAALHLRLAALEAAPVGIVITDVDGIIEWANPRLLEMTGYRFEEVRGQHTRLFSSGKQPAEFYRDLWTTVLDGRMWQGQLVNRRKDGSEYVEAMEITPVQDASGTIRRFVAAKQDVTRRTEYERRIRALNDSLQRHVGRLDTLHRIDGIITGHSDTEIALAAYARAVRSGLGVDAAVVFHFDPDSASLVLRGSEGFLRPLPDALRIPLGSGLAGRVASERATRVVHGAANILAETQKVDLLGPEAFEAFAASPMLVRGQLRGVLQVGHRSELQSDERWVETLEEIATQGAILIDNATLLQDLRTTNAELRATYDTTIEGWSRALDLRDRETEGHSRRVTELTLALGRALGLDDEALTQARRGALLHDIGKLGVPDSILQKAGPLDEAEWVVMRRHPVLAHDLLYPIPFLRQALDIPYAHHERWDGTGYPRGLRADEIPLAARVFAVADVFDALTSNRPYRPAWTREQALEHIRDGAETHFDPTVVDAFLELTGWASRG